MKIGDLVILSSAILLATTVAWSDTFQCELYKRNIMVAPNENPLSSCGQVTISTADSPQRAPYCLLGMQIQGGERETWLSLVQLNENLTIEREATLVFPTGHPLKEFSLRVQTNYGSAIAKCVSSP